MSSQLGEVRTLPLRSSKANSVSLQPSPTKEPPWFTPAVLKLAALDNLNNADRVWLRRRQIRDMLHKQELSSGDVICVETVQTNLSMKLLNALCPTQGRRDVHAILGHPCVVFDPRPGDLHVVTMRTFGGNGIEKTDEIAEEFKKYVLETEWRRPPPSTTRSQNQCNGKALVIWYTGVSMGRCGYVDARETFDINPLLLRRWQRTGSNLKHPSLDKSSMERIEKALLEYNMQRSLELKTVPAELLARQHRRREQERQTSEARQTLIDAEEERSRDEVHATYMTQAAQRHGCIFCDTLVIDSSGMLRAIDSTFSDCRYCCQWLRASLLGLRCSNATCYCHNIGYELEK